MQATGYLKEMSYGFSVSKAVAVSLECGQFNLARFAQHTEQTHSTFIYLCTDSVQLQAVTRGEQDALLLCPSSCLQYLGYLTRCTGQLLAQGDRGSGMIDTYNDNMHTTLIPSFVVQQPPMPGKCSLPLCSSSSPSPSLLAALIHTDNATA